MDCGERADKIIRRFKKTFFTYARHFDIKISILEHHLPQFMADFPDLGFDHYSSKHTTSPEYARDMHRIILAAEKSRRLHFLNCYYALNFLKIFEDWVEDFSFITRSDVEHAATYSNHMKLLRQRYPKLITSYFEALVSALAEGEYIRFALTNVGALIDQDDIDIGVICLRDDDRAFTDKVVGRLQTQMIRSGLPIHNYLSETIGTQGFAVTIEEYQNFLNERHSDIIVISQLLGAVYLTGDYRLYCKFENEVLERYHFGDPSTNYFHERYLFGAVEEISRLIGQEYDECSFNPKDDAYRLVKLLLSSLKTIYRIRNKNLWEIIHELKLLDHQHRALYEELEEALGFFEACRVVYQITIAQDDMMLCAQMRRNIAKLARVMGYTGQDRADVFLGDYATAIRDLKNTARKIRDEVVQTHLRGSEAGYDDHFHEAIDFDSRSRMLLIQTKDDRAISRILNDSAELKDQHLVTNIENIKVLQQISSRYFKFYLQKMYLRFPTHIEHLTDGDWFQSLHRRLSDAVEGAENYHEKREALINLAVAGFVRLGLGRLGLINIPDVYEQFFTLLDFLLISFVKTCDHHIHAQLSKPEDDGNRPLERLVAIYITGGYGRGEIYNDDIDLIIICHPRLDRKARGLINAFINQLNGFAEQIGATVDQVFGELGPSPFLSIRNIMEIVERNGKSRRHVSYLLQARHLLGDSELDDQFQERLVRELYHHPERHILAVVEAHRERLHEFGEGALNIKEEPGALLDIAGTASALRILLKIDQTNTAAILESARMLMPESAALLNDLRSVLLKLRRLRELYRLTIAPDERLHFNLIQELVTESEFNPFRDMADHAGALETMYHALVQRSNYCIEQIHAAILKRLQINTR